MNRFKRLDEIDGDHWKDEGRSPYSSGLWGITQAARAALARRRPAPVEPTLGDLQTCWCGQPVGHPWPGDDEGKPHPR